jgi:hypothetical protein
MVRHTEVTGPVNTKRGAPHKSNSVASRSLVASMSSISSNLNVHDAIDETQQLKARDEAVMARRSAAMQKVQMLQTLKALGEGSGVTDAMIAAAVAEALAEVTQSSVPVTSAHAQAASGSKRRRSLSSSSPERHGDSGESESGDSGSPSLQDDSLVADDALTGGRRTGTTATGNLKLPVAAPLKPSA